MRSKPKTLFFKNLQVQTRRIRGITTPMVATEVTVVEAEEARVTTGGHPEGVTTNPAGVTTIAGPVGGLVTGPALSEVMLAVKLAVEAEVVGKPEVPGIAVGVATAGVTAEVGVATVEAVGVAVMTAVGEVAVAVVRGLRGVAPGAEVGVAGIIQTTMVTRMNVLMVMEIIMTTSAPQRVRLPQMPRLPLPLP